MKYLQAPSSPKLLHSQRLFGQHSVGKLTTALTTGLAAAVLLSGCAGTGGIRPEASLRSAESLGAVASKNVAWPADAWWSSYGDPALGKLIEQGLRDSPTLKVATARYAQAVAKAQAAGAELLPQAQLAAQSTRQRLPEHYIYPAPLGGSMVSDNVLRLGASWDLDLFGRDRAVLDAAVGLSRASEADQAAARWLLSTQIGKTYFDLARLVALREVAQATRDQREQVREIVADRVRAGLDTNVELRQAEGAVPQTRQTIETLDEQIGLTRHMLALLIGAGPHDLDDLAPHLAQTPGLPAPSVIPADLLGRRPDVVGARWRVEAALRGVDAARKAFYPNVNLAAFVGFHSLGLDNWLKGGSREFGITPAISLPIFEGGRLRAELKSHAAEADAAIETYNLTVAVAVREVADVMTSMGSLQRQAEQQALAQAAAESAYDLALTRYQAGLGTYLTVLSAESTVLAERRSATELKARALDLQVSLVRALGGGYAQPEPPATAQADATPTAAAL